MHIKFYKCIGIILLALQLYSCGNTAQDMLPYVTGYWEIKTVTLANGSVKTYKYNETIDYIRINDSLKGFRKKLKPGINNTYYTNSDAETLQLNIEGNTLKSHYKTPFNTWEETIISATENELKIINATKDVYTYKRYTAIELTIDN